MGDLNSMEELERQLRQAMLYNDAARLDADEIGRLLGEEARRFAQELKQLTKRLEKAGLIRRRGDTWELTPYAIRKIGERALQDIFGKIAGSQMGDHNRERSSVGVDLMEDTKPYAFGDPFHLNVLKTVTNAVLREGQGTPVHIRPEGLRDQRYDRAHPVFHGDRPGHELFDADDWVLPGRSTRRPTPSIPSFAPSTRRTR